MSYRDEVLARAEALLLEYVTSAEFVDHCDPECMELESMLAFFPDLADHDDLAGHVRFVRDVARACIEEGDYDEALIEPWIETLFASPRLAQAMRLWIATTDGYEDITDAWYLG